MGGGGDDGWRSRALGAALVGGVGVATLTLGVANALGGPVAGAVGTVWVAVPFLLVTTLGCEAVWLYRSGLGADGAARVVAWTAGGGAAAGLFDGVVLLRYSQAGTTPPQWGVVLCVVVAAGTAAGFVVGALDARRLAGLRRLDAERDHGERLEQQLRVLNRVLRHDVRNDANVIEGYADLLGEGERRSGEVVPVIRERARSLTHAGTNARRLEQLLDADRLTSERVDVAALARAEARRVDASRRARVDTDIPERAPVVGNRLLAAAIENVVENAVEHNDSAEPSVTVAVERDGDTVTVSVADNGPGIGEAERAVLERGTETPLRHSSGLGLWLANWVVEDCGGRVSIRDTEPRGCVVSFELRAAD